VELIIAHSGLLDTARALVAAFADQILKRVEFSFQMRLSKRQSLDRLCDCGLDGLDQISTLRLWNDSTNACISSGVFEAVRIDSGENYWHGWIGAGHHSRGFDLGDHCKSGPRLSLQNRPTEGVGSGTSLFYSYSAASCGGKSILVGQLRGLRLSTCP
jgi:hypothetical protein